VVHSEGKDEERVVPILRFQDGSPHLCRLRTALFWPRGKLSFVLTTCRVFMGFGKPSSSGTILLNRPSLL
jgi:hypothetical protein